MDKGHAICRHLLPLEDCSVCSRFGAITTAPIPCPNCAAKDAEIERLKAGPRCSITGNPCGTDTWTVGNEPDCHCGKLYRRVRELEALRGQHHMQCAKFTNDLATERAEVAHLGSELAEAMALLQLLRGQAGGDVLERVNSLLSRHGGGEGR